MSFRDPTPAERGILFDAQGNAFKLGAYGDSTWNAASHGRELKDWRASSGSADADNLHELPTMVARSRDMARNEPVADAAYTAFSHNVVGTGLQLIPMPDYEALGWTKKKAKDWARKKRARFRSWFDSVDMDASRTQTGGAMTGLTLVTAMTGGGAILLPCFEPETAQGNYGTCLQLLEIDHLCNPDNGPDTDTRRGGIDIDHRGMPLAYWLTDRHPGDQFLFGGATPNWVRVPAYNEWLRRNVIHVYDKKRPGETRGTPLLAAFMPEFKVMSDYKRSEAQAAFNNSLTAALFKSNMPFDQIRKLFKSERDYLDYRARNTPKLAPGATIPIPLGDDLVAFNPGRPNPNFAAFLEAMLRHGLAGVGIPYEAAIRDFSKTNYSSARAAMLEAWRAYTTRRHWLGDQMMKPIWELWLEEDIARGDDPDVDMEFLFANWAALTRCKIVGPGRGWIDPVKEAQAAQIRMKLGLTTYEMELMEQGLEYEEVAEQIREEREFFKELGIPYPGDQQAENPRAVAGNNGGPPLDDENPRRIDPEFLEEDL